MTRRRWAVLLTAETGDRKLLGPWRDPAIPERIAMQLVDELATVEYGDPDAPSTAADRMGVDVVELEPWRGYRAALAWAIGDPAVQL